MNKKKLAVILPGTGYTPFMPLLFYAANSAEERGYDICWVDYCPIFAEAKSRGADGICSRRLPPRDFGTKTRPLFHPVPLTRYSASGNTPLRPLHRA